MDRLTKVLSWLAGLIVIFILFYILGDILKIAVPEMGLSFLVDEPSSAGRKGGIFPVLVSTLWIVTVCMSVVLPVGLATAFYLSDYNPNKKAGVKTVRKTIEILSGVPSIVFGLFGNALFSIYFGMGFSILSGGLTLACMAMPLFVSTVEKGISSVPRKYFLAGNSLGLSQWSVYFKVIGPLALPSIFVGSVLSIGRALAETAALIFTSGYVDRMPESLMDSGRSLSIHIYDLAMNVPGGDKNAYKTAFVLISLILIINLTLALVFKQNHKKVAIS